MIRGVLPGIDREKKGWPGLDRSGEFRAAGFGELFLDLWFVFSGNGHIQKGIDGCICQISAAALQELVYFFLVLIIHGFSLYHSNMMEDLYA